MKTLFIALCLSVILAILFATFTSSFEFKTKLKKIILKYVLRTVAFIYLFSIFVCLTFLHPLLGFFYLLACFGIFLIIIGVVVAHDDINDSIITIIIIGAFLGILCSIGTLTLNFKDTVKEISKEEVILNDFSSESQNPSEKVIVIELNENGKNSTFFAIKTYNYDIELPFYFDADNDYEIVKDEKSKIVITNKETTGIDVLAYFNFKKPDVSTFQTETLYINSEDILYN